jgi:hypothetical protein
LQEKVPGNRRRGLPCKKKYLGTEGEVSLARKIAWEPKERSPLQEKVSGNRRRGLPYKKKYLGTEGEVSL